MNLKIRENELNKALNDFYNITKIHITVLDSQFNQISSIKSPECFCSYIQSKGFIKKCKNSDKELLSLCAKTLTPQMHICHAGLVDFALPIIYNNAVLGYILMGRVLSDTSFEQIFKLLSQNKINTIKKETLKQHYKNLNFYNNTQIKSAANLAIMLINYIITKDMLKLDPDIFAERVRDYILKNLKYDLSVNRLCKEMGVSKNNLYKYFQKNFNCRVNEYVTKCRLDEAKRLLKNSTEPISVVCELAGIPNYPYFCRLFKEKNGLTPLQYRRLF